jgi:hypothetical protein
MITKGISVVGAAEEPPRHYRFLEGRPLFRVMFAGALLLAVAVAQTPQRVERSAVFAAGTRIPVRFPRAVVGGRDRPGTVVEVQAMAPLEAGGCILVPAFTPIRGTVMISRPDGLFGRRGFLQLRFDSVLAAPDEWVPVAADLDSLEWTRRGSWTAGGGLERSSRSIRGIIGTAGLAGLAGAATGLGLVPLAAVTSLDLVLRGPRAQILAGQRGLLRLTRLLVVPMPDRCERSESPASDTAAAVPLVAARATNKRGTEGADPINLVIKGTRSEIDSALSRAGWLPAQRSTVGALAVEAEAVLLARRDSEAPMSHEYYHGRVEDLRFERASPSARARHHVRLWQADSTGALWAAAATEDVGMLVSARRRTVTHRVAPEIDKERELLVSELLAGGCAVLEGYVSLPGATRSGKGVAGQPFVTDARTAVMRVVACPRYARPL